MQQFRMASAGGGSAEQLVARCLAQLGPVPPEATLGFVYASDALAGAFESLVAQLRAAAPAVDWVGTLGIALSSTGREFYDEPALVLMVTDLPRAHFRLLPPVAGGREHVPAALQDWAGRQAGCFALVHGDPGDPGTPAYLDAMAEWLPAGFINGGLTSSNTSNYQLAGDRISVGAISGVLFDDAISVLTDHTQGCTPIGTEHRISDAEGNVLRQLDGRRALDVMKADIGEVLARDLSRIGGYIFVALPVSGSDTGDYLVRNLLALDTRQGLLAVGEYLDEHDRLMFCRRDGNSAREDMDRMLQRLKRRLAGRRIRGGIYISCLGRGRYQFGEDDRELRAIRDTLGDFPLIGFFANGEIYNGRLYGYTGVLTLFPEPD